MAPANDTTTQGLVIMRAQPLQSLLDAAEAAVRDGNASMPSARPMAAMVFERLRAAQGALQRPVPTTPPACTHLPAALANARAASPAIRQLADAIDTLALDLAWYRRQPADGDPPGFPHNHANAVLIGDAGLEQRSDVRIGISLLAPATTYPNHRHPPEEVYIVLSPGQWRQDDRPWLLRASGDLVHNPPCIWHAMQADQEPLLALWMLWTG